MVFKRKKHAASDRHNRPPLLEINADEQRQMPSRRPSLSKMRRRLSGRRRLPCLAEVEDSVVISPQEKPPRNDNQRLVGRQTQSERRLNVGFGFGDQRRRFHQDEEGNEENDDGGGYGHPFKYHRGHSLPHIIIEKRNGGMLDGEGVSSDAVSITSDLTSEYGATSMFPPRQLLKRRNSFVASLMDKMPSRKAASAAAVEHHAQYGNDGINDDGYIDNDDGNDLDHDSVAWLLKRADEVEEKQAVDRRIQVPRLLNDEGRRPSFYDRAVSEEIVADEPKTSIQYHPNALSHACCDMLSLISVSRSGLFVLIALLIAPLPVLVPTFLIGLTVRTAMYVFGYYECKPIEIPDGWGYYGFLYMIYSKVLWPVIYGNGSA